MAAHFNVGFPLKSHSSFLELSIHKIEYVVSGLFFIFLNNIDGLKALI